MTAQTVPQRPSEARERLLRTASGLFTQRARMPLQSTRFSRAQVTRATFYRHFPSKDDLLVQYIRTADQGIRDAVAAATYKPTAADSGVRALCQEHNPARTLQESVARGPLVINGWLLTDHDAPCKRSASRCRDRHPHTLADSEIARWQPASRRRRTTPRTFRHFLPSWPLGE